MWTLKTSLKKGFETFFQLFNSTLDRHAPIKKSIRKEEKIKSKPWITKDIKTYISIRDKLYKEMIKEKNVLTKVLKHESFKKYQNQIINLLRISKQTHYNKFFKENKKNCPKNKKKLNTPTSLIDEGKIKTNSKDIVEHFNKFFTKIDKYTKENLTH